MQGIFEFAGAKLRWDTDVHPQFPLIGTLNVPYRWRGKHEALGDWIADARERLRLGQPIDLSAGPFAFKEARDAFDMGALFDGIDGKEGSFAAIHCNKVMCYRLASAAGGGYQAIEEVAAVRLQEFADAWDASAELRPRAAALAAVLKDCFKVRELAEGEVESSEDSAVTAEIRQSALGLATPGAASSAINMILLARKRSRYKIYRSELWRDAERAVRELAAERCNTMGQAADRIRHRVSISGRKLPRRTVSTPLLLKGLEFDHVVVPDASHFVAQRSAQAKLFYVAISRATHSLTISSPARSVQFPVPNL